MSKELAKGANYVMKGTKETVAVTTKLGGDVAVTVIHHAKGAGRVAVKAGAGAAKAVTSILLGK